MRHLLKVAYKRENGTWHYPYAAHPRFSFWALNMIRRHEAIKASNLYLKRNPRDQNYDVEEMLKMLEEADKPPSLIRRLQSANENITGSPSYWYTKSTKLRQGIEQKNCGTLFISSSMADSHWPELHRLLGTECKSMAIRQKAVLENPHIVNSFFIRKQEAWNKMFFEDIFETEWIWLRLKTKDEVPFTHT